MQVVNYLDAAYPTLAENVGRISLAKLPTPVEHRRVLIGGKSCNISIKHDDLSSDLYGGNKVRKLEYLLAPRTRHRIRRFATFGTVGSNHALATAIYARQQGFECTCFLAHQKNVRSVSPALQMHAGIGTEIVPYGGPYRARLKTLRESLWGRKCWVVPAGGSSWIGTLGFVNAGLELAEQIDAGEIPMPQRLYVATGTMGTAAGIALGMALAGLRTEVQAVRVSATPICNEEVLDRLIRKTASMMHRLDRSVPPSLADAVRIRVRHAFFAGGYAHSNTATDDAVRFAGDELGMSLETTYTGKAMAAMLNDMETVSSAGETLFWNTFNSAPLPISGDKESDLSKVPAEFHGYLDPGPRES